MSEGDRKEPRPAVQSLGRDIDEVRPTFRMEGDQLVMDVPGQAPRIVASPVERTTVELVADEPPPVERRESVRESGAVAPPPVAGAEPSVPTARVVPATAAPPQAVRIATDAPPKAKAEAPRPKPAPISADSVPSRASTTTQSIPKQKDSAPRPGTAASAPSQAAATAPRPAPAASAPRPAPAPTVPKPSAPGATPPAAASGGAWQPSRPNANPNQPSLRPGRAMPSEFRRPEPSRPGTVPGVPGYSGTSPGIPSPPGAITDDLTASPADVVVVIRRGAQLPDTAFMKDVLSAEAPLVLEKRLPLVPLVQRTWWASEEALAAGAKELARGFRSDYSINPDKTTWHVAYGPGHAKVLLLFLRK